MVITIPGATKHIDYTQPLLDERQKLVYNNIATCGIIPLCMVAAKLFHRMQAMGSLRLPVAVRTCYYFSVCNSNTKYRLCQALFLFFMAIVIGIKQKA